MSFREEPQSTVVARGQDMLKAAGPIMTQAIDVIDQLEPFFNKIYEVILQIIEVTRPFHLEELLPAMYGLMLCFFGGTYMMVTSAIEAFRLFGFDKVAKNVRALSENFRIALDAFRKDNKADENRDGIADVQQMENQELLTRRVAIFFKSVNPDEVFEAIDGLLQGWLAVVATLKTKFAKYIAIGAAIGDTLNKLLGPVLTKIIQGVLPPEYDRWAPVSIRYGFRVFGVSIAWTIARVVNSFYSSSRGAEIFLVGLMSFLGRRGYMDGDAIQPGTIIFNGLFFAIAASGFLLQFRSGYSVPFPFNVLLFPITILEWFLTWAVAIDGEVK